MAYTNLSDLFTGICDAIRAKKGTTVSINHQDIPAEIEAIESGGETFYGVATASLWTAADADGILAEGNMIGIPINSKYMHVTPTSVTIQKKSSTSSYTDELLSAIWYDGSCCTIRSDSNDADVIGGMGTRYDMTFQWNDSGYLCIWIDNDVIINGLNYYYTVSFNS